MDEEQEMQESTAAFNLTPFDDPGAEDFYVNLTGVGWTLHEFVLVFGRAFPGTHPKPGEGPVPAQPTLRVALSPTAARNLHGQLGLGIERYEQVVSKKAEG